MANKIFSSAVGFVGRGSGSIFRFVFAYLFIITTIIQIISIGIANNWDVFTILREFGSRLVGMTQNLQSESLNIISTGATFSNVFEFLMLIGTLFFIFYGIYLWIKILYKLWSWSPFSNDSNKFINLMFAVTTFLLIQILYNFLFSSPLDGQTKFDLFVSPIWAFVDFFKAVVIILSSTNFNNLIAESNSINNTCISDVCLI